MHGLVLAAECTVNFVTKMAGRSGQGCVSSCTGKRSSQDGLSCWPLLQVQKP